MTPLDWSIVAGYCLLVLALGIWAERRGAGKDTDSYFLSGRNLPWWIAGASMAASAFSADTPLYVANLTRGHGVSRNWEWWYFGVSGILGATIMARYWRRAGIMTDLELITLRYTGRAAHVLRGFRALFFGLLVNPLAMAAVIIAIIKIAGHVDPALVNQRTGWPEGDGVWLIGGAILVTVSYSVLSGFMGVVLTDLAQFVVSMIGASVMAVAAVSRAGGLEALRTHPEVAPKLSFLPSFDPWEGGATAFAIFLGVSWWTYVNADGGGKYIQRLASCRDETEAERATWFSTITFVAVRSWPWILVGLAGIVLFPEQVDAEGVYPKLMMQLDSGWRGFVFASLVAAFMSTIDTQLNWGASYLINDLVRPYLLPGLDERRYVHLARLCALPALGMVLLFFWLKNQGTDSSVLSVTEFLRGVILVSSGLGAIYLLRWFWWRLSAWGEIAGMAMAPVAAACCKAGGLEFAPSTLTVTGATLLTAIAVSRLGPLVFRWARAPRAGAAAEAFHALLGAAPLVLGALLLATLSPWGDSFLLEHGRVAGYPAPVTLAWGGAVAGVVALLAFRRLAPRAEAGEDPTAPDAAELETLRAFVARVRPAGRWRIAGDNAPPDPGDGSGAWLFLRFLAGNAILFGLTFTIGGLLLGRGAGVVGGCLALLAAGLALDAWARRSLRPQASSVEAS